MAEVVLVGEMARLGPHLLLKVRKHLGVALALRLVKVGDDELGDGGGCHLGDQAPVEVQCWDMDNVLHDIFVVKFSEVFSERGWHIVSLQQLRWLGQ